MTNPLDYTIQDPEAMRYALMQDSSYRRGGAVRMEDGGKADEDLFALKPQPKPAVPTVRELVAEIGRNQAQYDAKYPPKSTSSLEQQAYQLMQAAKTTPDANRYLESLNPYFDSQLKFNIGAGSDAGYVEPKVPNLAVMQQLQDVKNTIPHELTHTLQLGKGKGVELERDRQVMQSAQALPAAMQQGVMSSKNGFDNMKEVWANINARAHEVNAAGGDFINSPEGRALFPDQAAQRDYYTKSMPGVNSMTLSTGTFVPNKAEGGILDGHPVFQTSQVPFAEYRHSIGMNQGGKHFDEGGEVSQSELDRMKFELAQAQYPNSPVMQATPRSPVQDFIGTMGGYMDKAGRFVSESIEPTAEKNPVKHFLADMLLAAPLKGAGTLMQDLTGTVRETDEDNPVRGVVSKDWKNLTTSREPMLDPRVLDIAQFATPVVKGATKLVGAGAKAIAPFATKVDDMVRELHASGAMPQPGLSIKDVTPKALAPANEQGFYSPTEAAALNLQRKAGNGQAFLNDLLKQENVRPDEIKAMGLDTFLKDKKNVTAAEVQDYIAQNKLGLGEARYGEIPNSPKAREIASMDIEETLKAGGVFDDDAQSALNTWKQADPNSRQVNQLEALLEEKLAEAGDRRTVSEYLDAGSAQTDTTKFKQYSLPGGENYREVVLTLPAETKARASSPQEALSLWKEDARAGKRGMWTEDEIKAISQDDIADILNEEYLNPRPKPDQYRSSHFDEPNILAHLRMSDRVTDGKKTLLVDEVQSDWHQAGRERGYKSDFKPIDWNDPEYVQARRDSANATNAFNSANGNPALQATLRAEMDRAREVELSFANASNKRNQAVPDAPYKEDWYQLALRRAVKEAIDGGYDRVALPTGARVAERFDLSKQIDSISHQKNPDGTYKVVATDKNGRAALNDASVPQDKLAGIVGKEVAQKIIDAEGKAYPEGSVSEGMKKLSGLDLQVGGEGMKKYYDEIYPGYLKKFGKKYGANVGKTTVDVEGAAEPLHYMDITPAMRKEFSTGIHMAKGGKVSFADSLDAMRHELIKAK